MKKFEVPEILIAEYDIEDVITTSVIEDPDATVAPGKGDNSLGWA